MWLDRAGIWIGRVAGIAATVAASSLGHAQGCAMCYNTAAAAKASAIQALRSGILVLLIPPLAICAGIIWFGFRARNRFNEPDVQAAEEAHELDTMLARLEPVESEAEELFVASDSGPANPRPL